jgi:hypothetical protein
VWVPHVNVYEEAKFRIWRVKIESLLELNSV